MKNFWISTALVPGISMCVALSACSGSSPEQTTDDVEEYCASVDDADEVCDDADTTTEATDPTPDAQQTGNFNPFGKGFNPF